QNYPNPFNPTTEISYTVPKAGNVEFKVFNVLGQEVFAAKINAVAGANSYSFNGVNLSSGLYFYQVQQGVNTVTKKMVLMK
ncbi:MAG: T9SS type A sorting domain-containing protein, partial [Calditrichia bacterium]|nr:T9SS type A sorting domain-containing protein [Calditrichia bacterium]